MPQPDKLMIGTQAAGLAGMVMLEDLSGTNLGIPSRSVQAAAVHNSVYVRLGSGDVSGKGWLQTEWHLNGIRHVHWNALRTICPTQTATVYIRTYSQDGKTFANYLTKMIWPENPPQRDHDTHVVLDFTIDFIQMVLQAELP